MTEPRRGLAVWLATCGGIGYLPIPGTFGAAVGLIIAFALARAHLSRAWFFTLMLAAATLIFVLGVWAANSAEKFFTRKDPGEVVIDEVVGQVVTFLAKPDLNWKELLAGFLLFRILDVIKPFPARRAEHLPGGWGIMTDDVVAGLYSLAALFLLGPVIK